MIRELIQSVSGLTGLFFLCAGSGLVVPLPEDFALLFAGMRVASGEMTWAEVLPVALVGVLTRDLVSFLLGRTLGHWLLERAWIRWLLGGDRTLERARRLVDRHGDKAIFMGRFMVGFRSPVFMVGGAMQLSLRRFLIFDLLGLVIAVPLTLWIGFSFGQPVVDGVFWALQRARVVVGVLLALGALWIAWRRWVSPG